MTTTFTLPPALVPLHPALRNLQALPDGSGYFATFAHLKFMVTDHDFEADPWIHASVSRRDKTTPTYADLAALKHYCLGDHRVAYQVFPKLDDHVDFSKSIGFDVLHLWAPVGHEPIPNFGRFGSI